MILIEDVSRAPLIIRHSGAGRNPAVLINRALPLLRKELFLSWIPASAGTTEFKLLEMLSTVIAFVTLGYCEFGNIQSCFERMPI